jgi:hypothetical protein
MVSLRLAGHHGVSIMIDVCAGCQAFWFDRHESLKLSAASTLQLMKFIGEHSSRDNGPHSKAPACPRCAGGLLLTNDLQRSTRFSYWRCRQGHGRFIRFFEFLREKNFIRPLSPEQIQELRQSIQSVGCSNCSAPIDLAASSSCSHCGSPISMLDMKQPQQMLNELRRAAEPRQIDPAVPLELERAKRQVEALFGGLESEPEWWSSASSTNLVQAGLGAIARWLTKSGV